MEVKFGKIRSNNAFVKPLTNHSEANFFENKSDVQWDERAENNAACGNRINDYDSNILENNAYQSMNDEMFKLEHKMGLLENTLIKLNEEIETLESLGYSIQLSDLKERKRKIEEELEKLNKEYVEIGLSARLSGQLTKALTFSANRKYKILPAIRKFISKKILARFSKKINCSQTMKEALENLNCINSNVDELIKMQVPYGETVERYERLTAYLNRANSIHSQITRNLNSLTKKEA